MQRRALAVLFAVIAAALVVTAVSAIAGAGDGARGWIIAAALVVTAVSAIAGSGYGARGWIIAAAALAIAGWLGSMAVSAFRG